MKLAFVLCALMLGNFAHALEFHCEPTDELNGFGITAMKLDLSDEDVDVDATIWYRSKSKPRHVEMEAETEGSRYDLQGVTENLHIVLVRKDHQVWTATVTSLADTGSVLACRKAGIPGADPRIGRSN